MKRFLLAIALVLAIARPAFATINVDTTDIVCSENSSGYTLNVAIPPTVAGETYIIIANMKHDITSIVNQEESPPWTNPCTWAEVPGAYSNGVSSSGYGSSTIWVCPNAVANTTATNALVTGTSGDTFLGTCMVPVAGLAASPNDQANNNQITSSVGTLITPSITGGTTPEFFIAVSNCANSIAGPPFLAAEGGVTFLAGGAMATNGTGGCPSGCYISTAPGSYAAGLMQSPAGGGNTSIASFLAAGAPTATATATATATPTATATATPTATPTPTATGPGGGGLLF